MEKLGLGRSCTLIELHILQHGNSMCLSCASEWRRQVNCKRLEEEAATDAGRGSCCPYFLCILSASACGPGDGFAVSMGLRHGVLGTAVPISAIHICSGLHPFFTVFQKVVQVAPFLISKLSPVEHQGPPPSGPGREEEELYSTGVFVLHSDSIYKLLWVSAETTVDGGLFCFLNI